MVADYQQGSLRPLGAFRDDSYGLKKYCVYTFFNRIMNVCTHNCTHRKSTVSVIMLYSFKLALYLSTALSGVVLLTCSIYDPIFVYVA